MNAFWAYFWPIFVIGFLAGALGSLFGYRKPAKRRTVLAGAFAIALGATLLWHGPFGAADRFSTQVERMARGSLESWEMPQVSAHLHHGPLTRRILLSGPADDFQRGELVKIIETIPGVSRASWSDQPGVPLIVEALGLAVSGFLLGLLVAYLIELRRRYNAQWNW
jgi:hypothetical protein